MLEAHQEYSLCHGHASVCRVFNNSLGESTTIITEIRIRLKGPCAKCFPDQFKHFCTLRINRAGRCTGNLTYSQCPESSHFLFNKRDHITLIWQLGYTVHCRYLSWVCMSAMRKAACARYVHTVCNWTELFLQTSRCKSEYRWHNIVKNCIRELFGYICTRTWLLIYGPWKIERVLRVIKLLHQK